MSSATGSTETGSNEVPALSYNIRNALVCLLLLTAVITAYHRSLDNGFVALDDEAYVAGNRQLDGGLSWENVKWAFTTNSLCNWHPLTWLSFMLDHELYGVEPGGYHLTALVLHSINTLVLYMALLRLTGGRPPASMGMRPPAQGVAPLMTWGGVPPAAVALLFAVHPINVESVAWASERKGLLSTLFWMLTLWGYARYAERPSVWKYLPVLVFFSLGLLAKQMLVTLPLVLLLLDYWPLERIQTGQARQGVKRGAWTRLRDTGLPRLVVEKLPLFALSVIFSVIAFVVQQKGGAMTTMESFPLEYRILNSVNSYVEYIRKLILPDDLAFFYPQAYVSLWRAALCGLFMAAVTAAVFLSCGARKRKYLLTGWLWYVVTLIPVIGIVQIGSQAMADRYAYVTTIGLFIMIVWGAADLAAGKPGRKIVALLSLSVLIISFTAYTRTQVRYWKNYMTLCSHAVKVTEGVYVAYLGMGDYMFRAGKYEEALVFFTEALKINTKNAQTRRCVGKTLLRLNRPGEAVYHLSASINLEKNKPDAETYDAMGIALVELGKPHMAIDFYKRAIELMPDNPSAYNNLGIAYLRMNDPVNSEIYFSKALAIRHDFRAALENLQMVRKNMAGKSRGEASGRPDGRRSDALR